MKTEIKTKYKKDVLNHLKNRYNERGKNFYFRSKQISKDLQISKYTIGRLMADECKNDNGFIELIKYAGSGSSLFKTVFGESEKV